MSNKRRRSEDLDDMTRNTKRPMPMSGGGEMRIENLRQAQHHNPGRKKKQRDFFKSAQLLRKYRKIKSREFSSETHLQSPKERKKPKVKPAPFTKEFARIQKEREEKQAARSETEKKKREAIESRERQRKLFSKRTKKGQPIMRHRMHALLSKLESDP